MSDTVQEIAEKVWYYINIHKMFGFSEMTESQIYFLPKSYIKSLSCIEIEQNWSLLPLCYQEDLELKMHRPCPGHNLITDQTYTYFNMDVNDGPPLKKINCNICSNVNNGISNNKNIMI